LLVWNARASPWLRDRERRLLGRNLGAGSVEDAAGAIGEDPSADYTAAARKLSPRRRHS